MPEYKWPEANERRVIGKRVNRIDGPAKASGAAKYTYDVNRPGMLHGKMLICPHAHAKITKIDTSAAEALPGVKGVLVIQGVGSEIRWHGDEIALVAAETEQRAVDGIRAIKVEYEVLPHYVNDTDAVAASKFVVGKDKDGNDITAAKAAGEKLTGDPDTAFKGEVVTVEGDYGIAVITHCCHESHGVVAEWTGENELTLWISTQNVSGIPAQIATPLKIPAGNVRTLCDHIGGGFGSKFSPDRWGIFAAEMARKTGKPVKVMLERDHELMSGGTRPSGFARIKVAAKKDGTLAAWESHHWGTSGPQGGTVAESAVPYVFRQIPNSRTRITGIATNTGPQRAWRAPNHPQGAALTMCALADLAAALNMDELEFFKKNVGFTGLPDVYAEELDIAGELIGWKKKWHARGDKTAGPIKRGLGLSIHTWGGTPHNSTCDVTINPDGSVVVQLGSQDLGTGTRTILAQVAAETFGINVPDVKVNIGDSRFKPSGGSGGSTTVGGVSSACRRGCLDAAAELLDKVAPALDAKPEELEIVAGKVQVKGKADRSLTWKQACAKLGMQSLTKTGTQPGPTSGEHRLASGGVGGVQVADVSVDIETGIVKMNEFVAVQDQGLVLNPKTCESQVLGAVIMGIAAAICEEKIQDPITGRTLNPDMEFYKLAGIGDIGNIKVHLMSGPKYDAKGVIGNGEPPAISPMAAISNAVANAIGVRVPTIPLTADKVLAALAKKGGVA
jgi:xanthine dehydrogenase YagR molybdenum-binding subunit